MLSKHFAMKNVQINVKREIFNKERAQKRESSVNMYRKYRIGDFPDIEITNASVIKPLIELSKVSFIKYNPDPDVTLFLLRNQYCVLVICIIFLFKYIE